MGLAAGSNLEIRCAEVGSKLTSLKEKLVNEALAVLEEQGVYAMFLYVKARWKDGGGEALEEACLDLLKDVFGDKLDFNAKALEPVRTLSKDLDDLLFARELLRTALSYARYHIKAAGSQEGS